MDQVLQLMFVLLAKCIVWVRPFLPAICFAFVWGGLAIATYSLFTGLRQGIENIRQLHRIPCAGCQYATGSYHLKCSVHPSVAFSEQAISCPDFESGTLADLSGTAY